RTQGPGTGAGKDAGWFEMPKGVTRDVVEQIKIAGHLDAREGEAAKCSPRANATGLPLANKTALIANCDAPRLNTARRWISCTSTGILSRPTTAASPATA